MAVRERYSEGRLRYMPAGLVEDGDGNTLVYPVDKGSGATTSLVEADGVVAVPPDVEYLDEGEDVEVQLFSTDVRPPKVFGAGEDDPALSRILDDVDRPRYLSVGARQGLRRLRDGITDVAVTTDDTEPEDAVELGGWTREWGLVVPAGNPQEIDGLADLVDEDVRFVNRTTDAGLRTTLGSAVAELADERGVDRHDVVEAIDGFDFAVRAHESPARKVLAGKADAGLGLRATAERLGMGFVSCGEEAVRVFAADERAEKPGVQSLADAIADADSVFAGLPGYDAR
jgi:putative molybdopterin biosynthesis protein